MAEIILPPSTSAAQSDTTSWVAQAQWATGINDNLVEPTASKVANYLKEQGWTVDYYHVAGADPEKQTNYTLKIKGVTIPEKAQQDWEAALGGVNGAQSNYIEFNREVNLDE